VLLIFTFLSACFLLFGEVTSIDWGLHAQIVGACAIGFGLAYLMRDKHENHR
jgi:hypothetical protein